MNPGVLRLRVSIYAIPQAACDGGHWSGVAELRAELASGAVEHYVIRPGTRQSTRAAAIDAAREAFLRDMKAAAARNTPPRPPLASPWAECFM